MTFNIISRVNPTSGIVGKERTIGHAKTYHDAILIGQTKSVHGQWWIESGAYAPTREEQLLLPNLSSRTPRTTKTKRILSTI